MSLKKIAIIPARSGSKGLPNKNILMLLDKPLIAYTIEAAIKSNEFQRVIVSTDSLEYKEISEKYGAEVILRDDYLSNDKATSFMVIEDVLKKIKIENLDYFMLLQPTSPFRDEKHIIDSIKDFEKEYSNLDFLVSMTESSKSADLIKRIGNDKTLKNYDLDYSNYRRQDGKEYYPNGAIFIGKVDKYLEKKHFFGEKTLAYFMNKEDSIDIDDRLDFEIAITIATKKKKKVLLLNMIKERIKEKKLYFEQVKPITLIGHSIFDYWEISKLDGYEVNNLGIAGISTKEYIDLILKKDLIKSLGKKIILFCGTNDMVIEGWKKEDTLTWINEIVVILKSIKKDVEIYLIEVPRILSRMDRANKIIIELNNYLKDNLSEDIKFVELGQDFQDKFGNLKIEFTNDGLHFNKNGYKKLKEIVEKEL
ncbi:cytidylyltransferase domain-containing protein [Cetobacterium somerae]|uniref:cytidylyltransferase domain-containing protein n=1 Tax=Cetobacterium somerae TaxID=188913 RepID=UPI00248DE816|nr:GDSL-type esterase/lipase family protein [Cetobacterium somerae]